MHIMQTYNTNTYAFLYYSILVANNKPNKPSDNL